MAPAKPQFLPEFSQSTPQFLLAFPMIFPHFPNDFPTFSHDFPAFSQRFSHGQEWWITSNLHMDGSMKAVLSALTVTGVAFVVIFGLDKVAEPRPGAIWRPWLRSPGEATENGNFPWRLTGD